jgi:hypothetical protein
MSTMIMSACWPLQGMSLAQKAVLISLADNANDQGVCWPSIPTIAKRICASDRAVQNAIKWLETAGIVTANRNNGRHTSYMLTPAAYSPPQDIHPSTKCTGAGDSPAQEMHHTPAPDSPHPSTAFTTPPHQVPSNRKEPPREPSLNRQSATAARRVESTVEIPDWLPKAAWSNWVTYRKKGKAPFTDRAAELSILALEDLSALGFDPVKVIDQSILRGWTGLFEVKATASATKSTPTEGTALSATWFETPEGQVAKGAELGLARKDGENGRNYKMRVFRAAGPGPWIEQELAAAQRMSEPEYERAFAFFHGVKQTTLKELTQRAAARTVSGATA